MKRVNLHRLSLAAMSVAVLLVAFTAGVSAQEGDADPPGRAARLAAADGQVSLQPAGLEDWAAADLNRPLTSGDTLWLDAGARAELDLGAAVIRLGESTGFSFLELDDNTVQMRLAAGTAILSVRQLPAGQVYEIDTPEAAVAVQSPGSYRVEVNGNGDITVVKVSDGDALVAGGADSDNTPVSRGQAAVLTGSDAVRLESIGPPDALDDWSRARDGTYAAADSRRYVDADVPGAQDLDAYGQWQYTPDDGYVWTPDNVPADWAPYSAGSWSWVAPWGWTWVDLAPWGYAPFHYGRWAFLHGRWHWVPGPRVGRSCFAPALVAWVGGARIGWFPLAPREAYVPAYGVSSRYLNRLNGAGPGVRPAHGPGHYLNAHVPQALTMIPRESFASGRPIRGPHRAPPEAAAVLTATPPAIAPTRLSVLGAGGARLRAAPRIPVFGRSVVARKAPPQAAPFERQLAAIQANGNRALAPPQLGALRAPNMRVRTLPAATGNAPTPTMAERLRALHTPTLPPAPQVPPPLPQTPLQRPQAQAREPFERPSAASPAVRPSPRQESPAGAGAAVPPEPPQAPGRGPRVEGGTAPFVPQRQGPAIAPMPAPGAAPPHRIEAAPGFQPRPAFPGGAPAVRPSPRQESPAAPGTFARPQPPHEGPAFRPMPPPEAAPPRRLEPAPGFQPRPAPAAPPAPQPPPHEAPRPVPPPVAAPRRIESAPAFEPRPTAPPPRMQPQAPPAAPQPHPQPPPAAQPQPARQGPQHDHR